MTPQDKIKKAILQVAFFSPFFSVILYSLAIQERKVGCPTFRTNGINIEWNPSFVEELTVDEVTGILVHELLHILCQHHIRRQGRHLKKWNIACDYVINFIVKEGNYTLYKELYYNKKYKGMSAEQVYDLLPESFEDQAISPGQILDTPLNTDKAMQELKDLLISAKMAGCSPTESNLVTDLITALITPFVDWRMELANLVMPRYQYQWKTSRRCKEFLSLPVLQIQPMYIVACIDVSGSIDNEMLGQFLEQIRQLKQNCEASLLLMQCDTQVTMQNYYRTMDFVPDIVEFKGKGGTDFAPPFREIEKQGNLPDCLIYLTDGLCDSFAPKPEYSVIWLSTNSNFTPPYGTVISINNG